MQFYDDDCGGSWIFIKKIFQNLTLAFCIGGTNCTYVYARTVEDETCCMNYEHENNEEQGQMSKNVLYYSIQYSSPMYAESCSTCGRNECDDTWSGQHYYRMSPNFD